MQEQRSVLILMDWCSSENRYVHTRNYLRDVGIESVILDYPGMAWSREIWTDHILEHYVGRVASYLHTNKVDAVIAHGMGARLLYEALSNLHKSFDMKWNGTVVAVSPLYGGLAKYKLFNLTGKHREYWFKEITQSPIWRSWINGRLSMSGGDSLVSDIFTADRRTAIEALSELIDDRYEITGSMCTTYVIAGMKDKVVSRRKVKRFSQDVNAKEVTWVECGHSPMAECPTEFTGLIRRYLNA